jgi:hypothetical protein
MGRAGADGPPQLGARAAELLGHVQVIAVHVFERVQVKANDEARALGGMARPAHRPDASGQEARGPWAGARRRQQRFRLAS